MEDQAALPVGLLFESRRLAPAGSSRSLAVAHFADVTGPFFLAAWV